MDKQLVEISKFLSFVLRHQPDAIGVPLDGEGWVAVDELLQSTGDETQSVSPVVRWSSYSVAYTLYEREEDAREIACLTRTTIPARR
jgi:RNA:NAD 2'-phosphotransferase (TPT1/KptA family)